MTKAKENTPLGQAIASEIQTSIPQWIEVCQAQNLTSLEVFIQRPEATDHPPTFRLDFGEANLDSDRQEQVRSSIVPNVEQLWSRITTAFPAVSSEEFTGFAFDVVADTTSTEASEPFSCWYCCYFYCCQSNLSKREKCWNYHC
jgi:hypothetical protein